MHSKVGAAMGFSDANGDGYLDFLTSVIVLSTSLGVAYIFLNNKTCSYFIGNAAVDANTTILGTVGSGRFGYSIDY